ncbi:hypothetical protein HDK90DRAFT_15103 [Phyllosticta capitalensis]|uniref:C2H2-type domain-containing protein n=1 Tax=Phyllosticta capitalensis TaxID=121624 RepID=A0ABR1Z3H8_9PEZI
MASSDLHVMVPLPIIAERVRKCLRSFDQLGQDALSPCSDDVGHIRTSEVSNSADRFRIWVGNIGAHRPDRGSLDYRLRDASHIKDSVLDLLDALLSKLENASDILKGRRKPFEKLDFESDSDSDSDFDSQPTAESPHDETELEQLMGSIKGIINMLLRTSKMIRNPAPHDHFAHSNQQATCHFEQYDQMHIREKFPKASESLVERLARATSARRNYLKYREGRHEKLSEGLVNLVDHQEDFEGLPSASIVASSLPAIIKKTSHFDLENDAYSESGMTQTSYASSSQDQDFGGLRVPPVPKDGRNGDPFQCPLCFGIVAVKSRRSWKKHVYKDLAPYICMFDSCNIPFQRFEQRRDWFEHELSHRSKWKCPKDCNEIFDTQHDLSSHLTRHPEVTSGEVELGQLRPDLTSLAQCSLCKENFRLLQLKAHLGSHQQQLALFALPSQVMSTDSEDESDVDSQTTEEEEGKEKEVSPADHGSDTAVTEGATIDQTTICGDEKGISQTIQQSSPERSGAVKDSVPSDEAKNFGDPQSKEESEEKAAEYVSQESSKMVDKYSGTRQDLINPDDKIKRQQAENDGLAEEALELEMENEYKEAKEKARADKVFEMEMKERLGKMGFSEDQILNMIFGE